MKARRHGMSHFMKDRLLIQPDISRCSFSSYQLRRRTVGWHRNICRETAALVRFDDQRITIQPSASKVVILKVTCRFSKAGLIKSIVKSIGPKEKIGYASESKVRTAWWVVANGRRAIREIKNAKWVADRSSIRIDAVRWDHI